MMTNDKYTLLTTGYGCSCPEQRHVPKEECLVAAQSVLTTKPNVNADASKNGSQDISSNASDVTTESTIPNEVIDNKSPYSPCGCFLWKERSKIMYADPNDDTLQCTQLEWAQLVCKQQQGSVVGGGGGGDGVPRKASEETKTNLGHKARVVELFADEECYDKPNSQEVDGRQEKEGHSHGAVTRHNKEISSSMSRQEEEMHKVRGFPVNYTLGDQVFPPREKLCLDWWYFRPIHLSHNPDFCIGLSSNSNSNSKDDAGGDSKLSEVKTTAVLKPCRELHVENEYWYYVRSEGYIANQLDRTCLEVQVGNDIGTSPLTVTASTCNEDLIEQKWYLHEDGRFQSLFDHSFISVSGRDVLENATLVTTHDKQDVYNKWLPYTMIISKEYGPEDQWAVLGVFVPLLIIEVLIVIACCIHPNNRNRRGLNELRRRRAGNATGVVRSSSLSGRRGDLSIDAISATATRMPS